MEILRDLGLEQKAVAQASPQPLMANGVFCTSLAGEEVGRIFAFGNHPLRRADYELASPTSVCDLPQNLLEPILMEAAGASGSAIRFNTEFVDLIQDADGVTASVKDRVTGEVEAIRCKYLIGADGGRSRVAETVGLPMEGEMALAGCMNIVFNADLTKYVQHRPGVLYWVLQPGADVGGLGAGLVRMVRPWNEWLVTWGYDISKGELQLSDDEAISIVRRLIGDDEVQIGIHSTSTWTINEMYASQYASGRVFCMGDAVHRHPPTNGLGSNTALQDAYNLCWKLKLVSEGIAHASLLDSYTAERQPVGKQIVIRSNQSLRDFGPIRREFGIEVLTGADRLTDKMQQRRSMGVQGKECRKAIRRAIRRKDYGINCHGVEMNQRYASTAVVSDGTTPPVYRRDPELYYQATTYPGSHLPHAWVQHNGALKSTLDLAGKGRFVLLTGIGGECWKQAALKVRERYRVPLDAIDIGMVDCAVLDVYGDWLEQSEVEEDGCILVRPDMFVAWRAKTARADATELLQDVFCQILGKVTPVTVHST